MSFIDFITSIKPYDFLVWCVILSGVFIFWQWHLSKDNQFDISDLVCVDGKLSSSKFMRTGSWIVMSYGFYLLAKTSPESLVGYAPLYGGLWVAARALDKFQQTNNVDLSSSHNYSESHVDEKRVLTNITLTEAQKDELKQGFYSEE